MFLSTSTDESYEDIQPMSDGYLYKLHFAHLPEDLTQEQIHLETLDQSLLHIFTEGTTAEWYFRLPKPITYTPTFNCVRRAGDEHGVAWDISIFIPNRS